ncbi:PREDICTED: ATP-binding cassette sub-family A member 12 [Crocodylus porosus]|uniref:ATP-binding cassette sub-family A member 12 n=1 Tax=Crocodylus porosus TaxID=8502 RepID=UPI00093CB79C|nr:PREDICTED: ATP-binding cassette sub-family A member 12 [Crocodylus porosus]
MASLFQHLRILLWKNWLSVKRQSLWSLVLVCWPVTVFIFITIIRISFPARPQPNCFLAPRNLPSAGFLPFLQTLLCDSDARCKSTPYTPEDLLPNFNGISPPRRKQRESANLGKDSHPSPLSAEAPKSRNASLALLEHIDHLKRIFEGASSAFNLTSRSNTSNKIFTLGGSNKQDSSAANLKMIMCKLVSSYIASHNLPERNMTRNIHRTFCFTNSSLLESFFQEFKSQVSQVRHDPQYQETFVKEMVSFLSLISQVQNETSLWHFLLMAPDVVQASIKMKDMFAFLQNTSSALLPAQKVFLPVMSNDEIKTTQAGATHLLYSLNCSEQGKNNSFLMTDINNLVNNWKYNHSLSSQFGEILRKIKLAASDVKDSARDITSKNLEDIKKYLCFLKGSQENVNRSDFENLNLFRTIEKETIQRLSEILKLEMNMHYKRRKSLSKEVYKLISVLLQEDFNGTSIDNITTHWKEIQSALKIVTGIQYSVFLNRTNDTRKMWDSIKMLIFDSLSSLPEDVKAYVKRMEGIPSLFSDYILKLTTNQNYLDQLLAIQKLFDIVTNTTTTHQQIMNLAFEFMQKIEDSFGEAHWKEFNTYSRVFEQLRSINWYNIAIIAYGQLLNMSHNYFYTLKNDSSILFNRELEKLIESATLILQEYGGKDFRMANISMVIQAIQETLDLLKKFQMFNTSKFATTDRLKNVDDKSTQRLSEIVRVGMNILYSTRLGEAAIKEKIDAVYIFSRLLLPKENNQTSLQHNTSLETEVLKLLHLALNPFLRESYNDNKKLQNCSAHDILHLTLQMVFENATLSESLTRSHCKFLFMSMDTKNRTMQNQTFSELFQLSVNALDLTPEFANVYQNNSEYFSRELSCVIQSLQVSFDFLSQLNTLFDSGNSWIQKKHETLTVLSRELPQNNESCQIPVPKSMVNSVFHSYSLSILIPFILNETYTDSLNFSGSSVDWHKLSMLSSLLSAVSQWNSSMYELSQMVQPVSRQSEWRHFSRVWNATGNVLTTKWNLTEVDEYVKLLKTMKKALILVDIGLVPRKTETYQFLHNSSDGIESSDLENIFNSVKLFLNITSARNNTPDLGRFKRFVPETLSYNNLYWEEARIVLNLATVIWNQLLLNKTTINIEKTWDSIKMLTSLAIQPFSGERNNYFNATQEIPSLFSDFMLTSPLSENFTKHFLDFQKLFAHMAKVNRSSHYLLISSLSELMKNIQNSTDGAGWNELKTYWHIAETLWPREWNSTRNLADEPLLGVLHNEVNSKKNGSSLPFNKELEQLTDVISDTFQGNDGEDSKAPTASIYLQALQKSMLMLKDLQQILNITELETTYQFMNVARKSTQRWSEILKAGVKILHDPRLEEATGEEKIDAVYNFSHQLLPKERNQTYLQHNTSLEIEVWKLLHLALSPFLREGYSSNKKLQNCSAQDILHLMLQVMFENVTVSESLTRSHCKLLFTSMDTKDRTTFSELFQLAVNTLDLTPEFANIYQNNRAYFSHELSCVIQSLQFSLGFLSRLNSLSDLGNSWIQEKHETLTVLSRELSQNNESCQVPITQSMVDSVFHSYPLNILISFILNETYADSLNFSGSSVNWKPLFMLSGDRQDDVQRMSSMYELLQDAANLSEWSHFSRVWNVVNNWLSTKWNLTEVAAYVKLLEIMKSDLGNNESAPGIIEVSHYVLENLNSPDPLNLLKLDFDPASTVHKTDLENVFESVSHPFVTMAETLLSKTWPWNSGEETKSLNSVVAQFLFLEFEKAILQVAANNSYKHYLVCLMNLTESEDSELSENITLLLNQAQIEKTPFTQNDTSEKHSSISELLKSKISRLQNLTKLLCVRESFKLVQHICYLPNTSFEALCEQSQFHEQLLHSAELSDRIVTNVINHNSISQELQDILIGDPTKLRLQMEWFQENLPQMDCFQDIAQYVATISSMVNITESATVPEKKELLMDVFTNVDEMKEELINETGMSTASISTLMEIPVPENTTQLISQILQLESCNIHATDPKLEAVTKEFCNLSLPERTRRTYILGVTLLRHLDVYNFMYKMFFPKELQKSVEKLLDFLTEIKKFKNKVASGISPLSEAINSFRNLQQSRKVVLSEALFKTNNITITSGSFQTFSKVLCNQEISPLFFESWFPDFDDPKSNSSTHDAYVQSKMRKYGIPQNSTSFCLTFYLDLTSTPTGALIWSFLKPMLLGKILYAPDTPETRAIMEKSNATLKQIADLTEISQEWIDKSPLIMNSLTTLNQTIPVVKNALKNPFVQVFIKLMVKLDAVELLSQINELDDIRLELQNNADIISQLNVLATLAANISACVSFDRIQGAKNVEELEAVAKELFLRNELFASIIFNFPSSSYRQKRSAPGTLSLPPLLNYTIRMSSKISQTTNRIRERIWTSGPHNSTSQSQIYSRAFIYIQDSIERAFIELQTGKSLQDIAVQVQATPFPCYNKDLFLTSVTYSLPFSLMSAWVLFIASFVKKLVQEKDLRLYEYMKMMGVNSSSHFFAWFIECACFLLVTDVFLITILKVGNILPKINIAILFLYLMDYSLSIIAMCYFISVFFNNTNIAALVGSLVYILTFFPFIVLLVVENDLSFVVKSLLCLLSPSAFGYASQYIARYEEQGVGLQWDNMYKSPLNGDNTSFGWMCWLILIDSFIYFILGWYIRNVFPGKYGMAAPWYFPLLPSYWDEGYGYASLWNEKRKGLFFTNFIFRKEATITNKTHANGTLPPNLEPEPTDLTLGVSLHGITKTYGSKAAVEDLNLNFYEGNITSLLGHNGAGKTTTISILTGLFPASSGTIYVYGKDIRTDQNIIRKNMGICMQHNVLFSYLTTKEHLLLYGYIKVPHWSKQKLQDEVQRTLKETGLYSHRHKLAGSLSGGMKRKLSISIAFLGGSRVVILDEPTTGVDPCSRRCIWEIISRNKKGRTTILSTHHLDEAEVLSDRIAFLEEGGLKCCGSPFYLKETFGDGYHLILTKKKNMAEECDTSAVTSMIQSHLPEAYLKEDIGGELKYVLPPFNSRVSGAYQSLLKALDTSLNDLHIGCYGISDSTMEEVFLNLTQDLEKDQQDDNKLPQVVPEPNGVMNIDEMSLNSHSFTDKDDQSLLRPRKLKKWPLLLKRANAMFIKRFHHTRRNVKGFIAQVILPVLFVATAMGLGTLRTKETEYPDLLLSPSMYGSSDQVDFFGNFNETTDALVTSMLSFPGTDNTCMNESNSCLKEDMLGQWVFSGNQSTEYSACNCTGSHQACPRFAFSPPHRRTFSSRMVYNLTGRDVETYLLETARDFLQKRYGGWSFGLPLTSDLQFDINPVPANRTLTKVWYTAEGYHSLPAYLNSLNNFILRANVPKNESSKHGIILSSHPYPGGQDPEQVMLSSLLDIIISMLLLTGYSITTASFVLYVVKEHQTKAKQLQHISGIGVTSYWVTNFIYDLALFTVPAALSTGVISVIQIPAFCNNNNLLAVFLLLWMFGYATFSWMYLLAGLFKDVGMAFIVYVCINLFFGSNTIITHSIVFLLSQENGSDQALYDLSETLRHIFLIFPQFCFGYGLIEMSQMHALLGFLKTYGVDLPDRTFELDMTSSKLLGMLIQGTIFFAIRLWINDGTIQKLWYNVLELLFDRVHGKPPLLLETADEDEDVRGERGRVESGKADFDTVQLQNLTRIYHLPHKRIVAVKNVSVGIPAGECFGLLGVNGAGKTTIFKMLTGDIGPSRGRLLIQDQTGSLSDIDETHWSLFGYCPQEDALDDLLTVEEHMYYYARLHGIPEKHIKGVALQLLHRLNLMPYKDKVSCLCSYGTNRKLSTALALIGNPLILLLDEPSSGMDPKAKRHLWKIITEEVQNKCSVILTSHSMEECEALCTRLAIMVNGSFQCIGSLQHIKSRFGSGFTVKMHLKSHTVNTQALTQFMRSHFPNTCLKDQHFSMVEYHVPVTSGGVANIFELLENNKTAFKIRHFSVSQTTLEEVFINFAKDQTDPDNSDASPVHL